MTNAAAEEDIMDCCATANDGRLRMAIRRAVVAKRGVWEEIIEDGEWWRYFRRRIEM